MSLKSEAGIRMLAIQGIQSNDNLNNAVPAAFAQGGNYQSGGSGGGGRGGGGARGGGGPADTKKVIKPGYVKLCPTNINAAHNQSLNVVTVISVMVANVL